MVSTITDIANMALTHCGAQGILASITDATKEGQLCKLHYDPSRRAVLRMHPWNFAIDRRVVGPDSVAPVWGDLLRYPLPADCIRVLGTDDADKMYKVEGRFILTDEATLNLKIIKDVTDTSQFDDLFVQCLALHLATRINYGLTQSEEHTQELRDMFSKELPKARHVDATEDYPPSLIADELVNVRIGPNRGWVRDPQT